MQIIPTLLYKLFTSPLGRIRLRRNNFTDLCGAIPENRTRDLPLTKGLLYQLS